VDRRDTMKRDVEEAYAQHRESLRAFFQNRTHRKDFADDLTQEVYLELRERPPVETLRDPALYLYKVAWNVLRRAHRTMRREPETHAGPDLQRLNTQTTEDAGSELTADEYLMHLLGQLPPLYGAVLALHVRDGLTYVQIGERLGVTTRSVKRHMEHVLAHLRRAQW
jgi:RNA polymerase sigma-70 factor (ECF subfamily)